MTGPSATGNQTINQKHPSVSDVNIQPAESLDKEFLYGQPSYPAAPLSWLAPLWAYVCGVAASAGWTWTDSHLLRLLSGLLLAGPLLGIAWAASTQTQWPKNLVDDPPDNSAQSANMDLPSDWQDAALPYTLSGSSSHRLATWLSAASTRWQTLRAHLEKPLLQLLTSTIFSLTVAAQLGQRNLALTIISLVIACAIGWGRGRWRSSHLVTVSVPLLITWLLGHAAYNTLRPIPVLAAAAFAVAFYGFSVLDQHPERLVQGLIWQIASQTVVVASLIMIRQPLVAAAVALLVTPQLLLLPLLGSPASIGYLINSGQQHERRRYFRAVQFQLAASMLLTALALGYTP